MPRRRRWVVLLVAALWALVSRAHAAEIEGLWLTEKGEARVEVTRCGDAYCGRLVWLRDPLTDDGRRKLDIHNPDPTLRDRPVLGLRIFEDARGPDDRGRWTGARIYDPDSGRTYRCTLRMGGPDLLKIRGYVLVPLLGRTTEWTRQAAAGDR